MRAVVYAALLLASCMPCEPYDGETYSCEPLPAGSPGCVGGPLGADPEQTFPANCGARMPYCPDENGTRTFICVQGGDSAFFWAEAI